MIFISPSLSFALYFLYTIYFWPSFALCFLLSFLLFCWCCCCCRCLSLLFYFKGTQKEKKRRTRPPRNLTDKICKCLIMNADTVCSNFRVSVFSFCLFYIQNPLICDMSSAIYVLPSTFLALCIKYYII